jgi:hypothetical protein
MWLQHALLGLILDKHNPYAPHHLMLLLLLLLVLQ